MRATALYYVFRLNDFHRFPLPAFLHDPTLIKLQTWFTLAAEFSLGVLIWIKLRYPVLLLGLFLHLTLEYSINAPMFQWTILALYLTFLDAGALATAWSSIRQRVVPAAAEPVLVEYDPQVSQSRRGADVLAALDIFGRLRLVNRRAGLLARFRLPEFLRWSASLRDYGSADAPLASLRTPLSARASPARDRISRAPLVRQLDRPPGDEIPGAASEQPSRKRRPEWDAG
ncbi:MAG: hypothetical protein ABI759_09145 [Candidatus Solibacter sp.]